MQGISPKFRETPKMKAAALIADFRGSSTENRNIKLPPSRPSESWVKGWVAGSGVCSNYRDSHSVQRMALDLDWDLSIYEYCTLYLVMLIASGWVDHNCACAAEQWSTVTEIITSYYSSLSSTADVRV